MVQSYKYYQEQPKRIREIDYEDLLLYLEEKPFHAEVKVLALMKQKFTFGQIDEELIHNLIATTSDKAILNEYLDVIEQFPSKSEYLKQEPPSDNIPEADDVVEENSETEIPASPTSEEDYHMTVVEEMPAEPDHETNTPQIMPNEGTNTWEGEEQSKSTDNKSEEKEKKSGKKKKKETRFEKVARKFGTHEDSEDNTGDIRNDSDPEDASFRSWLYQLPENPRSAREFKRKKKKIKKEKLWKKKPSQTEKLAEESVQENEEVVSETLADLYVQQGLTEKAKDMYTKLSLKFPEKSIYFAAKIKELKNLNS
ncbi:hypothetical protein [Membranihabitans maritimus]|uniref:hypothetical protein n=1 Tax=Membranihabitans maritimus TaxID=2904244 RepID=UPI001F267934|nr:hypothetical protein [Membranihabitans maritimus]